ncbi:MAG TPA: response regulator transcription factor [Steroidobacteraceae bacterium]|jgi:two-component system nitrate/nitrite response regulator NarL|nr:response regulator transcription factor [Steroidobacteraceae bacterium]
MNLLSVDDHALFREGLCALLANISPGVSIHEAACVEDAIDECKVTDFRMVLLDLGLSTTEGLGTLDAFRGAVPEVSVVVLSGDEDPRNIRSAIDLGAVGFIPKAHTSKLMIAALQFVLAGGIYLPPNLLHEDDEIENGSAAGTVTAAFARLSPRQQEVARLLLQGKSNKAIARRLDLSEGTVKAHVSAIFQIIGAKSRVEAVIIAAKSGIKVL